VFVTSQSLASQWPLIAAVSIGVSCGPVVGAAYGLFVGPARWLAAVLNEIDEFEPRHLVSLLATSFFYGACGAVFGWLALLLRRAEREIADRRARDEVGRVLHDTVLQTLALVERRVASTDPELAAAAAAADRELRAFLFEAHRETGDDLDSRVHSAVNRACERFAVVPSAAPRVSVNVIDDGCRLSAEDQELLARALGAAVTNALEHAEASSVVVFVETDVEGQVFASVRDDGVGFDPATPFHGHGLAESITARIASIGGRAEVRSAPGSGTEVLLWSKAPAGD
jgi:signal transduction histidine kinase